MMGAAGGWGADGENIATNISVLMSLEFSKLMNTIFQEANDGAFATKADAARRRNELVVATVDPETGLDATALSMPTPAAPARCSPTQAKAAVAEEGMGTS